MARRHWKKHVVDDERAQHVDRAVREVDDVHHAEHEREPRAPSGCRSSRATRPTTALWTSNAAVMDRVSAARGPGGRVEGPPMLLMRREELHDERRDPVLHLGERHRIDDLVGDAVVLLAAEVRLAPEVVELDDDAARRRSSSRRHSAPSSPPRRRRRPGWRSRCWSRSIRRTSSCSAPASSSPARGAAPARSRGPRSLDVRLAGDVGHHRGVDLPDVNEPPLESELARLLDDQARRFRRARPAR